MGSGILMNGEEWNFRKGSRITTITNELFQNKKNLATAIS
jgi:hypothetical protein